MLKVEINNLLTEIDVSKEVKEEGIEKKELDDIKYFGYLG